MTPDQLREWAETLEDSKSGLVMANHQTSWQVGQVYRQHAAALEEIERLNAAWKAQQFHLEAEERESAHWKERAEKAERRAERLKGHAEAMAKYLTIDGQSCRPEDECSVCAILSAYRADKGE